MVPVAEHRHADMVIRSLLGRSNRLNMPGMRSGRFKCTAAFTAWLLCLPAFALSVPSAAKPPAATATVTWKQALKQEPSWYDSAEAVRIADNVLLYQNDNGGWAKNIDMATVLTDADRAALARQQKESVETTIDNGATYTQMNYLARVYSTTKLPRFRDGFLKGVDFLLAAQYPNGGWPQFYPLRRGYYTHITFNDDAMIGAMTVLRHVARKDPGYDFVDTARCDRAAKAIPKGIDCILNCQIRENGKLTAWCAQHDEATFAPAWARKYEPPSLSGGESVGIVEFLMGEDHPSTQVIASIQGAVAWFNAVKITGIKVVEKPAPGTPKGYDRVVVADPAAPPLWARFYEIGTNRPIFESRDSVKRFKLADISYERRNGYSWYRGDAHQMLQRDYPVWQARWDPQHNVLAP